MTLLHDEFAPTTSSICFLRASLKDVSEAYVNWHKNLLKRRVQCSESESSIQVHLRGLDPLAIAGAPKSLLCATESEWTAYFDNSQSGTDAGGVRYLSRVLNCEFLHVTDVPHEYSKTTLPGGRLGSVQFNYFPAGQDSGPRIIYSHFESAWEFGSIGDPLPFEQPEKYLERRKRDRFTSEMLENYCKALGVDVFNPAFYGPFGVQITDLDAIVLGKVSRAERRTQLGLSNSTGSELGEGQPTN